MTTICITCGSLVLLHYPWKHEVNVKLDRIQPLEIWSKKVGEYHVFSTPKEVTPIISEVKGYGLHKRPIKVEPPVDDLKEDNTDQLIDQAQALIDTAKTFVTKPVGQKQPRKQPTAKAAKSVDEPKALDILHNMTMNKLATFQVDMDGSSWPSDTGSSTPKRRKIKCKMCTEIFGSIKGLNIHQTRPWYC